MIEPEGQQLVAIDKIKAWFRSYDARSFMLSGYAGVGKTSLMNPLIKELGLRKVIAGSLTGKATTVLSEKLPSVDCRTIHSWIYKRYYDTISKTYKWMLNRDSGIQDAKLVIIDESSMLNEQMYSDLLSFGVPILFLGDPFQLQPINGRSVFDLISSNYILTEVHRQALESPIYYFSQQIREGLPLQFGNYEWDMGNMYVLPKTQIPFEVWKDAEINIVAKNKTRVQLNRWFRSIYKRTSSLPQQDDRLLCVMNNYRHSLFNGNFGTCVQDVEGLDNGLFSVEVLIDGSDVPITIDEVDPESLDKEQLNFDLGDISKRVHFSWGYSGTCHKVQGSEFKKGIIINEPFKDAERFLYTALTRFSDSVWVGV